MCMGRECIGPFLHAQCFRIYEEICLVFQDAQVTMECVIPQKFHRSIMGPKGSRIQQITRDHNVQIKFPEREDLQGKTLGSDS